MFCNIMDINEDGKRGVRMGVYWAIACTVFCRKIALCVFTCEEFQF